MKLGKAPAVLRSGSGPLPFSRTSYPYPTSTFTSSKRWKAFSPTCYLPTYATVHGGKPSPADANRPARWPTSPNPSPYEVFDQTKTEPYSKARFYELVKLYHPDRHHHTLGDGISHLTKTDRYRLVVAANNILCDPEKRKLYDRYGAGWEGQVDTRDARTVCRDADRKWRRERGNASMNATWEDWEQWHQQRNGQKQEPVFMSNTMFGGMIALLAVVGAWEHATRAGRTSVHLLDTREQQHSSIVEGVQHRQRTNANLNKEDRVRFFLQQREGWGYGPPGGGQSAEPSRASLSSGKGG